MTQDINNLLFTHHPHPMWIYDLKTLSFLAVNHAAVLQYGYSEEEFLQMRITDIRPEEDVPALLENIEQARSERQTSDGWRHRHKDGSVFYVRITSHTMPYNGRQAVLVIVDDVTEHRQIAQTLKQSQDQYRQIVETAQEGIWIIDAENLTSFVNTRMAEMLGYTREQMMGRVLFDFMDEAGIRVASEKVQRRREGIREVHEFRLKHRDGSDVWALISTNPLQDENGRYQGALAMLTDITKRKEAEMALSQSEARFRTLVQRSTDIITIIDVEGMILYQSPAAQHVLGYRPQDMVGENCLSYVHPDDLPNLLNLLQTLINQPQKSILETFRFRHQNGSWRMMEGTAQNLLNDPNVRGIVTNVRDVTERVKVENALRESEEKYQLLYDSAPDMFVSVDPQTTQILQCNQTVVTKLGYANKEEIIGRSVLDLYHPDSKNKVQSFASEFLGTGRINNAELQLQHKDGRTVDVMLNSTAIRDASGNIVHSSSIWRDITDLKQAQDALAASERLYRTLTETIPHVIWSADADGQLTFMNKAWSRLTGFTQEQSLGNGWTTAIYPDDMAELLDKWEYALKHGGDYEGECRFQAADGSLRYFWYIGTPVFDDQGKIANWVGINIDITEQKEARAAQQEAEQQLQARVRQQAAVSYIGRIALTETDLNRLSQKVTEVVANTLKIQFCKVLKLRPSGGDLLLWAGVGWHDGLVGRATVEADHNSQAGYTLQSNKPVIVSDLAQETRFSGPMLLRDHSIVSGMSTIIQGRNGPFGILSAHTSVQRHFTQDDINFLVSVANVLAAAVESHQHGEEQERLLESERNARQEAVQTRQRLAFLVEAGKILGSSLDYEETLRTVTQMATPQIADWCVVNLLDENSELKLVSIAHVDPEKVTWARQLHEKYNSDPDDNASTLRVLQTGKSEIYHDIPDEVLVQNAKDKEHLSTMRKVGLNSLMLVPMKIHGKSIGTISFISSHKDHLYDEADLVMAEELAARAATAVDNARLYQKTKQLNTILEDRVRQRTAQLEAANADLESFAYSVSHDLRAPLRAMDGYSRILLEDFADDTADKAMFYLKRIRLNAQQMGELIDALLTFSRLGRQTLKKELVQPETIVKKALDQLQQEETEHNISITIQELPPCQADRSLLTQVFINLLANAFKYTRIRQTPQIIVGATAQNGTIVYFVQDNGIGFDIQYADKIFGVFQRLHRAEEYEGTGVGLATVQRIIHRHKGIIWAEAEVDKGATFYFTLGSEETV